MTTNTSKRPKDPTSQSAEDDRAALDQRRGKWQIAQEAATRAENRLTDLDQRLEDNAAQYRSDKAALQEAVERQSELKKSIKASARQRDDMRTARERADRVATKAKERAQVAEAKYEKALLADMLREKKSRDLSAPEKPADGDGSGSGGGGGDTVAQSTARETAAAVTARNAHA